MEVVVKILNADESWEHQRAIYKSYHREYSTIYSLEDFFYHPYLITKFSVPNLSEEVLKTIEAIYKKEIYPKKALVQAQQIIHDKAIPFLLEKNMLLRQLPIKQPSKLTIYLSGAYSGGFYDASDKNPHILITPQTSTLDFIPLLVTHEYTHICIEDEIQKQKLPHLAKERIVSRICSEILSFEDYNSVGDKKLDKYLTKDNLSPTKFLQTLVTISQHYKTQKLLRQNVQARNN